MATESVSMITTLVGATATISTIGQFFSGIFTVQKVQKQGTAGDISPFPFLMATVGSALWLAYGQMREDNMVIYCNVIGTIVNAVYVLIFIRYVARKGEFLRQILVAGIFLAMCLGAAALRSSPDDATETLGRICVFITLICCGSPLIALKQVIATKSTEILPFPLIFSMFLVCLQWWFYGILTSDSYMQITNFMGTLIALVQLALFVIYPSKAHNPLSPEHKYDLLKS